MMMSFLDWNEVTLSHQEIWELASVKYDISQNGDLGVIYSVLYELKANELEFWFDNKALEVMMNSQYAAVSKVLAKDI